MVKISLSLAGDEGSILGQGAKIPYASWPKNQNVKQKQYCNTFSEDFKSGLHFFFLNLKKKKEKPLHPHLLRLHQAPCILGGTEVAKAWWEIPMTAVVQRGLAKVKMVAETACYLYSPVKLSRFPEESKAIELFLSVNLVGLLKNWMPSQQAASPLVGNIKSKQCT